MGWSQRHVRTVGSFKVKLYLYPVIGWKLIVTTFGDVVAESDFGMDEQLAKKWYDTLIDVDTIEKFLE